MTLILNIKAQGSPTTDIGDADFSHGHCVDTSAGGLLVPGDILQPVFSTGMVIVSIPLLEDY